MLASLPTNEQAATHWSALRELLLGRGFVQITLTNFEQAHYRDDGRRFLYEELSFQPDRYDMAGFGPGAISFAAGRPFNGGLSCSTPMARMATRPASAAGSHPGIATSSTIRGTCEFST